MNKATLMVLSTVFLSQFLSVAKAQLPDEINYPPHEQNYSRLSREVGQIEDQLEQIRSDLSSTIQSENQYRNYISDLEDKIADSRATLASYKNEVPGLQSQISNGEGTLNQLRTQHANLSGQERTLTSQYNQEYRELQPIVDRINNLQNNLKRVQDEIASLVKSENHIKDMIEDGKNKLLQLEQGIAGERAQQLELRKSESIHQAQISQLQTQLSQLGSAINLKQDQVRQEEAKLSALNQHVEEAQKELNDLTAQGAPEDQLAQARRKLSAVTGKRNEVQALISTVNNEIRSLQSAENNLKRDIENERNQIASIPQRIAQSEAREQQLVAQKVPVSQKITQDTATLNQSIANRVARENELPNIQRSLSQEDAAYQAKLSRVNQLQHQVEVVKHQMIDLQNQIASLQGNVDDLKERLAWLNNEIPRLQNEIASNQESLRQGQAQLTQILAQRSRQESEESKTQIVLNQRVFDRETAHTEYQNRLNLYNYHLDAARELGASQVSGADVKGSEEGSRIATRLSARNGEKVGTELGLAEAKYWGLVRGETLGYNDGHLAGINSTADINLGTQDGKVKGLAAAEAYAQTNLKPKFFEEWLMAELAQAKSLEKSMRRFNYDSERIVDMEEFEKRRATIPDLTQAEIDESLKIKTSLDPLSAQSKATLKSVADKALSMARPEIAFEEPTTIPYGSADCSKVYKGVQVFKDNCTSSYLGRFKHVFVSSASDTFGKNYQGPYKTMLGQVQIAQREKQFPVDQKSAYDVAQPEGLKVGKKEAFDQAFAISYKKNYDSELPLATDRAKVQANQELQDFKIGHALVTSKGASMPQASLRGGDAFDLNLKLKNIGATASTSPLLVEITEAKNVVLTQSQVVLPAIAANASELKKVLALKVADTVRSGDKVSIKGKIHLPGDKYKAERLEEFSTESVMLANPKLNLKLDYLEFPDIRSVFRTRTHYLTVSLSPAVEDIPQGYELKLAAIGENKDYVVLNVEKLSTGSMKKGENKDLDFSYYFYKAANGREIQLELQIVYSGLVVEKKILVLKPN